MSKSSWCGDTFVVGCVRELLGKEREAIISGGKYSRDSFDLNSWMTSVLMLHSSHSGPGNRMLSHCRPGASKEGSSPYP